MGNCNCKHGTTGQGGNCPECDILQMARNNYFTGKLLVERDFTDEQRYTMGKLRRHNQRMHGWGVACGLKVKPHPNPACQAQYVVIEPGIAIDCCGREILVQYEEYFDFESTFLASWQKQNGPNSQPDGNVHPIQICISYKECATEQVPAIFDDCSSGGASCQPNRILEGHDFGIIIDPVDLNDDSHAVSLAWEFTKNIANVVCTAEDGVSNLLYVLTSAQNGGGVWNAAVYVIDKENYALAASATYTGSQGLGIAVDSLGQYVYVAVQASGVAPELYVYDAAGDFTSTVSQVTIGSTNDSTLKLVPVPGVEGGLLAYGQTAGFVVMNGLNGATPSQMVNSIPGLSPLSAVLSEHSNYGYVATSGSSGITMIQISGEVVGLLPGQLPIPSATQLSSLAISATANGDTLAALDAAGETLSFVTIPPAGPGSATVVSQTVTGFAYKPTQVLLSPGGRWVYVLEQDTSGASPVAYVQAVDVNAVLNSEASVLGPAVAVGITAVGEALSQDGRYLYVSFIDTSQANMGGVAIVEVVQAGCGHIFERLIDGCPDCSQGNCVVLATIAGYTYQSNVTESDIDNLQGRRLLPSTDLLAEAIECLIDQLSSTGLPGSAGQQGPKGDIGATGPGLETGLVQINALSWVHGDAAQPVGAGTVAVSGTPLGNDSATQQGIVIGFSDEVQVPTDITRVFEVIATPPQEDSVPNFLDPRPMVSAGIYAVTAVINAGNPKLIDSATVIAGSPATTKALAFVMDVKLYEQLARAKAPLFVRLRGAFVLDTQTSVQHAISADFVRFQLPTGFRPQGSNVCLEGGTFESWFTLTPPQ